jgi:uncharacterized lipoprotein NlpE involved in copper resistance
VSRCLRLLLAASAVAVSLLGCANREHMSDTYGRSSRAFFAKQHVYAQAAPGAPTGLDSEESALIQARYRKSLTGSSGDASSMEPSSRVLLLRETPNAAGANH